MIQINNKGYTSLYFWILPDSISQDLPFIILSLVLDLLKEFCKNKAVLLQIIEYRVRISTKIFIKYKIEDWDPIFSGTCVYMQYFGQ